MDRNDRRLNTIKSMLESERLESFQEMLDTITVNFMREALGGKHPKTYPHLMTKILSPRKFTIEDLIKLARALDCDPIYTVKLALKVSLEQWDKEDPAADQEP